MALIASVKGVPFNQAFVRIDIHGNEHLFMENGSGSMIHCWPAKGIIRTIVSRSTELEYFYTGYSHVSNCYYLWNQSGYDLIEYNPITGETKYYEMQNAGALSYTNQLILFVRYYPLPYIPLLSTDGNIYINLLIFNTIHGYIRFNVTTKEFDEHSAIPDQEFFHIHAKTECSARYLVHPTLGGVYSNYVFTDDYIHLRNTIISELNSAGVTYVDTGTIWVNYADRALLATNRRVIINITGGTRILDIKVNPLTNWINPATNLNQAGVSVDTTGWISGVSLYALNVQAGIPSAPTLSVSVTTLTTRKVGRFVYVGYGYIGNKTHFFTFGIHPITGEALYPPPSFNKYTTFLNNSSSSTVYKCNFGGLFGFSSNNELVQFLAGNGNGLTYFIRPDNNAFEIYNPITNPDGYVIRAVTLNSTTDPDGLGCYHTPRFTNSVLETIDGLDYYVDNNFGCKTAIGLDYGQENFGDVSTVTYNILPDRTKPDETFSYEVENLYANPAVIIRALEFSLDKILCVGELYNGAACINYVDANTFTVQHRLNPFLSSNGVIRLNSTTALAYGYSGVSHIIDAADWNNIKKIDVLSGSTNEVMYAATRTEGVVIGGISSRSASHHEGASFNMLNLTTKVVSSINDKFPNEFTRGSAINLRSLVGLTSETYSDTDVEIAVQAYMTSSGKSRATVIAEFLNTCRWKIADMYTSGNKTYVGLANQGVLGLKNIRIEQTVSSGIWINENYYSSSGGKALLIDSTNIYNLQPSEIKPVTFNLTPNVNDMGRIALSDNYVAFLINYDDGTSVIRIVTKTGFDTAANGSGIITSLPTQVNLDAGIVATNYGFGDGDDFNHYDTHETNAYVTVGDILYVTYRSTVDEGGGLKPCVLKVNLTDGSVETFAKSATMTTRCISFLDNRMLITNGVNVEVVNNFTSQVGSITI